MKTAALSGLVLVAVLGLSWFVWSRLSSRIALDLRPADAAPEGASIFQGIQEQLRLAPDKPLDDAKLPPIRPGAPEGITFAPGLGDALFGSGKANSKDWLIVREAVRATSTGRISDWRVLERNVSKVPVSSCVDTVLGSLRRSDITPSLKRTFWEMARRSRNYEAVKWGIAIGGIELREDELPDLLLLARHGEFALYTSHALLRESEAHPEFKKHLVALLPNSYQWGVIRLIDYIVLDKNLIGQKTVQRDVLIYGMENNEGIPMEVAFTIAKAVDVAAFAQDAVSDDRVYRAMVELMDTLMHNPQPLGGLTQLDNWASIYEAHLSMLQRRPPDSRQLVALGSLQRFLEDDKLDWPRRATELGRARTLWGERFSADVLRKGLAREEDRWAALTVISDRKVAELLPEVEAAFVKRSDFLTLRILTELGDKPQLEMLLGEIPRIVDLEARKSLPLSTTNVHGPRYRHEMEYAQIVEAMGRLATPAAVGAIKVAAADFNPHVRAAACKAVAKLPLASVDDELRTLIVARLSDSPKYVAEEAHKAAAHLGLAVPETSTADASK